MPLSEQEMKRYTRQMMIEGWGEAGQEKLKHLFGCMLERGYRVRAVRRLGTAKDLACVFPEASASREQRPRAT